MLKQLFWFPVFVALVVSVPLYAKSGPISLQDLVQKSDVVVTAWALETNSIEKNEIIGIEVYQCRFLVKQWIKGDSSDSLVTVEYRVNFDADSSQLPCPKVQADTLYFLFLKTKDSLLTPVAGAPSVRQVVESIIILDGDIFIKYAELELVERIQELVEHFRREPTPLQKQTKKR